MQHHRLHSFCIHWQLSSTHWYWSTAERSTLDYLRLTVTQMSAAMNGIQPKLLQRTTEVPLNTRECRMLKALTTR